MLFCDLHEDAPKRRRPHRLYRKGGGGFFGGTDHTGSTSTVSNTSTLDNSTTDNRVTVGGDQFTGSGNTVYRADANALQATANLLGDISFDMSGTIQNAFDNNTVSTALFLNNARALADTVAGNSAAAIASVNAARESDEKRNAAALSEVAKAYNAAKPIDTGSLLFGLTALGGLAAILFRKK